MAKTVKPTIETGAMTLVLLVKYYKSQMIALLLKNGVTVPNGASDQQIAMLMANLLKVSKSFFVDLNNFIENPKVVETIAGGMTQTAEYFRMSGKGYMNAFGDFGDVPEGINYQSQYGLNLSSSTPKTTSTTPDSSVNSTKSGFFSNLNFGNLFSQALGAFGQYNTNQSNVAIANAHSQSQQAGGNVGLNVGTGGNTGSGGKPPKSGTTTTTIVVLSLLGVAVVGTIIYFVARPKK
jgi:hypothetical protein